MEAIEMIPQTGLPFLYSILGVAAFLWLAGQIITNPDVSFATKASGIIVRVVAFILLCGMELYYFLGLKGNVWFCDYEQMGFWKTVLGFLAFSAVMYIQYSSLRSLLKELPMIGGAPVDYRIGLYSYVLLGIVFIVSLFISGYYGKYAIEIFLIVQAVQLIIIIIQCWGKWLFMLANTVLYFLGTFALLILLYNYLQPLLMALGVAFVGWFSWKLFTNME